MFIDKDEEAVAYLHKDMHVVKVTLVRQKLNRSLVDGGSSLDFLLKQNLVGLKIGDIRLDSIKISLKRFERAKLISLRIIDLLLTIGSSQLQKNSDDNVGGD